jgi:hypothetical protein
MQMHVSMIECCMDMLQYVRQNTVDMEEDQVIVALIGASVFNSIASALRLLLSGYYQSSGLQIRFILESGWLLDYLKMDPKHVQDWKNAPENKRQQLFGPARIRDALDTRDGFTEKKRAEHYKRLCILCGHPTFSGFTMLRPKPGADAHMGPFLVPSLLEQCVQELVMVATVAWQSFMRFFPPKTLGDFRARIHSTEKWSAWFEFVYERPSDRTHLNALKSLMAEIDRQS